MKKVTISKNIIALKNKIHYYKSQCIKGGETENLTYQLSWIQNKLWHVYSEECQGGLCRVCVLFNQNLRSKPGCKFVKTAFQDVCKSEKIAKHEAKEYHKDPLENANNFLESNNDHAKSVTHDKDSDEKYERNIHIIKIIIRAVLLCAEQGIVLRFFK